MRRDAYQRGPRRTRRPRRYLRALHAINGYTHSMHEHHKDIAVLYHGSCPDGFGGAYAAWKKFGDTAEYIPVKHGWPVPEGLAGRKVFILDFSYPQEEMDFIVETAGSVTILDHHLGAREVDRKSTRLNSSHSSI